MEGSVLGSSFPTQVSMEDPIDEDQLGASVARVFPDFIKVAVAAEAIPFPAPTLRPSHDEMIGHFFREPAARRKPFLCPRFSALDPYVAKAGLDMGHIRAPASCYLPYIEVDSWQLITLLCRDYIW